MIAGAAQARLKPGAHSSLEICSPGYCGKRWEVVDSPNVLASSEPPHGAGSVRHRTTSPKRNNRWWKRPYRDPPLPNLTRKTVRLAKLRANLNVPAVLRAISDLNDLDWQIVTSDPTTGPFELDPGHDLQAWMPDQAPRHFRDVARQLAACALQRIIGRLKPLSLRASPEGSPWLADTPEQKEDRMLRLRIRMVGRLTKAVRDDGVPGLIAIADNRSVEDVVGSSVQSLPPLSHDQIEAMLAQFGSEEFVESDPFAKGMVGQEIPSAKALTKAAAAVRTLSWGVVASPRGNWMVRGGRAFNSHLRAEANDERSVAKKLVARAVRYLAPRSTGDINEARKGLDRYDADRAVQQLLCGRIADAVRSDGYLGLGRLMVQ